MIPTLSAETSVYRTAGSYGAGLTAVHLFGSGAKVGPALLTPRLRSFPGGIRSRLGGGGRVVESCVCFQVCDGNGENCTKCSCDPPGCGTC
jgi:hypothetical protein